MTLSGQGHELMERVRAAAEGTPYVVTETERGFDVTLDVVNASWYGVLNKAGVRKVFTHHVSVEDGTYTIVDDVRSLEWVAGTPRIAATAERQYGRVIEFGAQKVWAFDEQGNFGVQAEYRFSSEEGRQLVDGIARQMGLRPRRGTAEKVGLVMGVIGGVGALVAAVVVGVMALMGKF